MVARTKQNARGQSEMASGGLRATVRNEPSLLLPRLLAIISSTKSAHAKGRRSLRGRAPRRIAASKATPDNFV